MAEVCTLCEYFVVSSEVNYEMPTIFAVLLWRICELWQILFNILHCLALRVKLILQNSSDLFLSKTWCLWWWVMKDRQARPVAREGTSIVAKL